MAFDLPDDLQVFLAFAAEGILFSENFQKVAQFFFIGGAPNQRV
ncbi:hypothetical protein ES703_38530 [subsurface metagenome]